MSGKELPLPDAKDIGLHVSLFRRATPLWLIYDAKLAGENVVAWRFLPAHLRNGDDGLAVWSMLPDWAIAGEVTAARKAAYSHQSASGWLVYPATEKAFESSMDDRKKLADLANHLLAALDRLHSRSTLHLDVHPANVRKNGEHFSLVGVGVDIRKQAGAMTGVNEGLARRGYGAPEMWDASGRSKLGPWTDIFAAAATMYYAICGKAPADFRERIGRPRWREAIAYDLNRELAKSGAAWPKMVEFIVAGLSPKVEERPKSVSDWSQIWKQPDSPTLPATGDVPEPVSLTAPPAIKPQQSTLRLVGNWLAGFGISCVAFYFAVDYLFNGMIQPLLWEGFAYSENKALMLLLAFQIMVLLSVDTLLPRLNPALRRGMLWPAMLFQFLVLFKFQDSNGWVVCTNILGWFVLMLLCSDRDDEGRAFLLWVGTISLLVCGALSYFQI